MSNALTKKLLPDFESIKDNNEEILWIDKPVFIPYILHNIITEITTFCIGLFIIISPYYLSFNNESEPSWLRFVALIPIGQSLYSFFSKIFSYSNTSYAYSNKRVMIRTGFIGTNFKIIDHDKVLDIEVKKNLIERICDVGTVQFFSGQMKKNDDSISEIYDKWIGIKNPYEVFKMVKQTAVDIKTDYNYPNALRPEHNTGYRTKYKPN